MIDENSSGRWLVDPPLASNEPNNSSSRWTNRSKEFNFVNSPVQPVDNQYILTQLEILHYNHLGQTPDDLYALGSFVSPRFTQTHTDIVSTTVNCLERFSDLGSILQPPSPISSVEELTNQDSSDDSGTSVSVSTAFYPDAYNEGSDTIFSTDDSVLFYVNLKIIMNATAHPFRSLLGAPLSDPRFRNHVISLSGSSDILNIILHMLYGTPSAQYSPTFETLVIAVDQMPAYDIQPHVHIIPPTWLYNLLVSLDDLAVNASSHLLSYSISTLSDELAERMGAVYLKRLLLLHLECFNTLKKILLRPLNPHPPTKDCDFHDQKRLSQVWALAIAYVAFDAKPGL
ncbi:uncharacterized protein LACBIDRAFT_317919 [Laccaria bicolor S238N-H82]|uniref:Predicted protein n=1 Tax=Laccaria bicolor (strain S238N-H82 / ATCC MYA-4686) TaxID=486041 RepID=B0D5I5_LACBS|nr:uncharacterized protein LACBIDRAFT_317919 [Laccaria bicolor S238N-H82]EDR10028.1 predicted protein [Laccaria bicolor S238N-H82]|eukprot:XP_001879413.1 predicted protein [Laccaria bicolor S238N-H82]